MRLSEFDSDDLILYLKRFETGREGILLLYETHREEIDLTYENAMERKKRQPVPPDIIIRCKDNENVSLPIPFHIYRTLLNPAARRG